MGFFCCFGLVFYPLKEAANAFKRKILEEVLKSFLIFMQVLPHQRQPFARVLSSVSFILFSDALNNAAKRLKICAAYIFQYIGFAQSVS